MAISTADGSVVIDVNMDVSQAEKRLGKLRGDIKKTEKEITDMATAKEETRQKSAFQAAELETEHRKLQEIKDRLEEIRAMSNDKSINIDTREEYKAQIPEAKQELSDQQTRIRMLQAEYNKTENAVDRYSQKIESATQKLDEQKTEAGILAKRIEEAENNSSAFSDAIDDSARRMDKLIARIKKLATRVFIFTMITAALRKMRDWLWRAVQTNRDAVQSVAQLKGALLTLAQPLVGVVIPAFTRFVEILTKAIALIAAAFSWMFGKTAAQSAEAAKNLYEEQKALEGVGSAADKASGSLAGFDEINTIQTENAGGVGGGASAEITPDFNAVNQYRDKLDELMVYLSSSLLVLGAILFFSGANIPLGLGLMVLGAVMLAQEIKENWGAADGKVRAAVTRVMMILGSALIVIGAILAFSGANLPLGIGLMAAGAVSLAAAAGLNWNTMDEKLRDALTATFIVLGGTLLVLGAILTFSGANIPLGIGMMALGAVGMASAAALNWSSMSEQLRTTLREILVVVGEFLLVIGIVLALSGVSLKIGLALMAAGAVSLIGAAAIDWGYMKDNIGRVLTEILVMAGATLLVLGIILVATGVGVPLGVAMIAAGAVSLVTAAALNWNTILNKLKDVWAAIKQWWNTNVAKYFTAQWWKDLGSRMWKGFMDGLTGIFRDLGNWASKVTNKITGAFSGAKVPSSSFGGGGGRSASLSRAIIPSIPETEIPRLARGAVIPPNREFMAVLGDQRNGTNLEAPEDLIRKIVREESGGGNGQVIMLLQSLLEAVRAGHVIMVDKDKLGQTARDGINDITMKSGKFALLF